MRIFVYAYEDEIRAGIHKRTGRTQSGRYRQGTSEWRQDPWNEIYSCINVRLSHQIPGCADAVMPYIQVETIFHTH